MTKKTKPSIKLGFSSGISIVASTFIFVLLIKNSDLASVEVQKALKLCVNMLIPALFPMTVAAEIMTSSGTLEKLTDKFSAPFSKILGVDKNATVPYFLGLLGGYTSSCQSAILLYKDGKISKRDCESIIGLSNMPSLAFVTGFIGVGIFESSTVGWVLWATVVLSTVFLGVINRIFFKKSPVSNKQHSAGLRPQKSFSKVFVSAIGHSAYSMLIICACVVFFSVLIGVLELYLANVPLSSEAKNIFLGAFEITKGVISSTQIANMHTRVLACAFFIGWSGLCVHFQVIALCEDTDISLKKYFIFKALQGIISTLLALLFMPTFY